MRIVIEEQVTDSTLSSTNVSNDYPTWSAGTYNLGDRAVYENQVYEVVADPSTTDRPDTGAAKDTPTWTLIGYSNQYRMFRDGSDSLSESTGDISVTVVPVGTMTSVVCLGLLGNEVQLEVVDATAGTVFDETISIIDIGVLDWWEWHFLDYKYDTTAVFDGIPPYPGTDFNLTISALDTADPVECGRVVFGSEEDLGDIQYGTSVGSVDYSIKERNGFGNLTLTTRRSVKRVTYNLIMDTEQVSYIQRVFLDLAATPAVYIGDENTEATILFGVYRDWDISFTSPQKSYGTLEVEGF